MKIHRGIFLLLRIMLRLVDKQYHRKQRRRKDCFNAQKGHKAVYAVCFVGNPRKHIVCSDIPVCRKKSCYRKNTVTEQALVNEYAAEEAHAESNNV